MSTSPSLCPDLDFSDCHLTASSSPEVRRPRGAPWASRRPRPYVDNVEVTKPADTSKSPSDAQVSRPVVRDDCPSPPRRRSTNKVNSSFTRQTSGPEAVHNDKDLLKTLFPELVDIPAEKSRSFDPDQSLQENQPTCPVMRKPINRNRKSDFRSWISIKNLHEDEQNIPILPAVLPVTPPRPLTPTTYQATTQPKTTNTAITRSIKNNYRLGATYSTKNSNRSILRSAAVHNFEQVTGITTASRPQPATQFEDDSDSESEKKTSQVSDIKQSQDITSSLDLFLDNASNYLTHAEDDRGHELDTTNDAYKIDTHVFSANSHQQENLMLASMGRDCPTTTRAPPSLSKADLAPPDRSVTSRKHPRKVNGQAQAQLFSFSSQAAEATSSPLRLPGRPLTVTGHRKVTSTVESQERDGSSEHDHFKQYVYKRILKYPHRLEEHIPRKGYKALEMGYLVPPPRANTAGLGASQESEHEQDSIRESKLKILGRRSQTEFRVLRDVEQKLREKISVKRDRKTRRKNRRAIRKEEENNLDADPTSEKKKPLSHLHAFAILGQSTKASAMPHKRNVKGMKNGHALQQGRRLKEPKAKPKNGKIAKKVALQPGHRPLKLQYPHIKSSRQTDYMSEARPEVADRVEVGRDSDNANSHTDAPGGDILLRAAAELAVDAPAHAAESCLQQHMQDLRVMSQDGAAYQDVSRQPRIAPPKGTITTVPVKATAPQPLAHTSQIVSTQASLPKVDGARCHPEPSPAHTSSEASPMQSRAPKHNESQEQVQVRTPRRKAPDICDILLPMSSHFAGKPSVQAFTLRTTNFSRAPRNTEEPLFISDNFDLQEDMSDLPSDLWYDSAKRPSMSQIMHNTMNVRTPLYEHRSSTRRILAASSSSMQSGPSPSHIHDTPEPASRPGRSSQYDWPSTDAQASEVMRTRSRAHGFGSYSPSDGDLNLNGEFSTPPYPTEALLEDIASRSQFFAEALQQQQDAEEDVDDARLPESDLTAPKGVETGNLPAPHQDCYTPAPTDDYHLGTEVQVCTVPTDIEIEYQHERRQQVRLEAPLEIPSLPPVPDSPEEMSTEQDATLQSKLDRYGRRIIGFKALAMRQRPAMRRTIPQDIAESKKAVRTRPVGHPLPQRPVP
ncbi:hypothetical protein P389DRAFT_174632 [Cystobasidium minutum MCA 4210]|uniref:uncharacterized protein n=1 Tax=Cystobasidium minutum MCA 4210 TaxID=1397322 RepID=UPI0034CEC9AE|eukprot:jgi/Rhomi1/174632/fgenesh1_kg.8_\